MFGNKEFHKHIPQILSVKHDRPYSHNYDQSNQNAIRTLKEIIQFFYSTAFGSEVVFTFIINVCELLVNRNIIKFSEYI